MKREGSASHYKGELLLPSWLPLGIHIWYYQLLDLMGLVPKTPYDQLSLQSGSPGEEENCNCQLPKPAEKSSKCTSWNECPEHPVKYTSIALSRSQNTIYLSSYKNRTFRVCSGRCLLQWHIKTCWVPLIWRDIGLTPCGVGYKAVTISAQMARARK